VEVQQHVGPRNQWTELVGPHDRGTVSADRLEEPCEKDPQPMADGVRRQESQRPFDALLATPPVRIEM
jgi:hypothetical protein